MVNVKKYKKHKFCNLYIYKMWFVASSESCFLSSNTVEKKRILWKSRNLPWVRADFSLYANLLLWQIDSFNVVGRLMGHILGSWDVPWDILGSWDVPWDTFSSIEICYRRKVLRCLVWLYTIIEKICPMGRPIGRPTNPKCVPWDVPRHWNGQFVRGVEYTSLFWWFSYDRIWYK